MTENMENRELAIRLTGIKKRYKLGAVGGATLQEDLQSWWAKMRGKPDPNLPIGQDERLIGKSFMALNGINLEIYKGEAIGIIGGNGAGKSTMLKLLSRVTAPTEGKVQIWGRIASMLEVGTGFHGELTGRENVYMNGAILGMTKAEIDAKMEDIIEFSEVRDFIDTPVKRYSSGMYVKLAFSVAAHLDSEIMIMDEVLAVGDMAFQKKCLDKMRDVAKKEGRTVLYVSHNMNTIRQLCDRCIVLEKGKVVFDGDVDKAIDVYMGIESSNTYPCSYDVSNVKRNFGFGKQVKISAIKFCGVNQPIYEVGTPIEIEIMVDSSIEIAAAQFQIPIKDRNYSKIGMTVSSPISIHVGHNQRFKCYLDLCNLANDVYCLDVAIIAKSGDNQIFTFDDAGIKMLVEYTNEFGHGFQWHKEYWGSVFFKPMECEKIE